MHVGTEKVNAYEEKHAVLFEMSVELLPYRNKTNR